MLQQTRTDLQRAQAFDMTVVVKNKIGRCHDCGHPGCDFLQTAATVNLSLQTPSWPRHCINSASVDLSNLPCRPLHRAGSVTIRKMSNCGSAFSVCVWRKRPKSACIGTASSS